MQLHDFAKLDRRTRSAFFGSMILLGAFFIYGRIVEPPVAYLLALNRYETAIDDLAAKNQAMDSSLKLSRKKLDDLTAQFSQVRNVLYTQVAAEEFFSDLQAISVETECPIYSLTFIGDEPTAEVKQVEQALGVTSRKALLSVAGMYENIMTLIERLQSRGHKVWVEGVHAEVISDDVVQVNCDIIIKIYTIQNKEASRYE